MIQQETTDFGLVVRIAKQDAAALAELYDRHSTQVYSVAVLITQNSVLAEQATQDAFMRVWTRASQYHDTAGASRFIGWLLTITRRCAINVLRREGRKSGGMVSLEDISQLPDASCEADARWRDLRLMLDGLPAGQRDVVVLGFYRGMSHSEIAEVLRLPLSTISGHARMALRQLRTHFRTADTFSPDQPLERTTMHVVRGETIPDMLIA